jgi:transglutaminase-like putative cysteine protease
MFVECILPRRFEIINDIIPLEVNRIEIVHPVDRVKITSSQQETPTMPGTLVFRDKGSATPVSCLYDTGSTSTIIHSPSECQHTMKVIHNYVALTSVFNRGHYPLETSTQMLSWV